MAIDPVCGMTVDEKSAAGNVVHSGKTWYFCSMHCQHEFEANPAKYAGGGKASAETAQGGGHNHSHGHGMTEAPKAAGAMAGEKAKDPICGMLVDKSTALKTDRAGRAYFFCSVGCQRTFESPEQELKSMRTRVMIAMTGVLALAILRAGAFLALATGATIVTWAPIPALPWFTWACGCSCWSRQCSSSAAGAFTRARGAPSARAPSTWISSLH